MERTKICYSAISFHYFKALGTGTIFLIFLLLRKIIFRKIDKESWFKTQILGPVLHLKVIVKLALSCCLIEYILSVRKATHSISFNTFVLTPYSAINSSAQGTVAFFGTNLVSTGDIGNEVTPSSTPSAM